MNSKFDATLQRVITVMSEMETAICVRNIDSHGVDFIDVYTSYNVCQTGDDGSVVSAVPSGNGSAHCGSEQLSWESDDVSE